MLHKCANPTCPNPFRRLSEGKLFLVEMEDGDPRNRLRARLDGKIPHRIEHFWLCSDCASVLTLSFQRDRGVVPIPLSQTVEKSALAPLHLAEAFPEVNSREA